MLYWLTIVEWNNIDIVHNNIFVIFITKLQLMCRAEVDYHQRCQQGKQSNKPLHDCLAKEGSTRRLTFFLTRDMMPILVRTCCRERPSRGTPSANVSAESAPGSQRWRMKREMYALNTFSDLPRRSRTNLHTWDGNTNVNAHMGGKH